MTISPKIEEGQKHWNEAKASIFDGSISNGTFLLDSYSRMTLSTHYL